MKIRKFIPIAGLAAAGILSLAACSHQANSLGQNLENATSSQDLTTYEQAQPAPHFGYSQIRDTAIKVEASQALGEQTTSFFFNLGAQQPLFSCPSIGDPVPNTAQLTNPTIPENFNNRASGNQDTVTVGNIDPNGLYAPNASSGTNVMCVNGSGQQYLVYWEGDVLTVNGAAAWDAKTGTMVVTGQPTMPSCVVKKVAGKNMNVCTK